MNVFGSSCAIGTTISGPGVTLSRGWGFGFGCSFFMTGGFLAGGFLEADFLATDFFLAGDFFLAAFFLPMVVRLPRVGFTRGLQ